MVSTEQIAHPSKAVAGAEQAAAAERREGKLVGRHHLARLAAEVAAGIPLFTLLVVLAGRHGTFLAAQQV